MKGKKFDKWAKKKYGNKNEYGVSYDDEHYFQKTLAAMIPKAPETVMLPTEFLAPESRQGGEKK